MSMRRISGLVVGMTLGVAVAGWSQEPPPGLKSVPPPPGLKSLPPLDFKPAPSIKVRVTLRPNETLAQAIARTVHESGKVSRYWLNVMNQEGVIDLFGEVADESQRDIVINIARSAPGIVMVRDYLQVRAEQAFVQQMQGPVLQPLPDPQPLGKEEPKGMKPPERIDGQLPEPMPIFQMPLGPNPAMQPPPLPPYAWPTYAPYNNYSRVAYPNAYPYEQWPFIGPMYPFPRVPLGWRSVSLTWEDGHWWFHRNPTGADWWRVRYW